MSADLAWRSQNTLRGPWDSPFPSQITSVFPRLWECTPRPEKSYLSWTKVSRWQQPREVRIQANSLCTGWNFPACSLTLMIRGYKLLVFIAILLF